MAAPIGQPSAAAFAEDIPFEVASFAADMAALIQLVVPRRQLAFAAAFLRAVDKPSLYEDQQIADAAFAFVALAAIE